MKQHKLTCMALLIAMVAVVAETSADNLVTNGQFDEGTAGWRWSEGRAEATMSLDSEAVYRGEHALLLTASPDDGDERVGRGIARYQIEGLEPDTVYLFEAQVRTEHVTRGTWISVDAGEGAQIPGRRRRAVAANPACVQDRAGPARLGHRGGTASAWQARPRAAETLDR